VADNRSQKPRLWVGQLGGVVVVLALILWFVQMRKAPGRLLERRDCERAYAAAQTRADSEAVDSRRPMTRAPNDTLTCGTLRLSGQLR
jgi:hypothetical protein